MFARTRLAALAVPSVARSFSSTSVSRADLAKMTLIGRLTREPIFKQSRSGKEYALYTVATSDAVGPPPEQGEPRPTSTSYHRVFAFNESSVNQLKNVAKGTQVYVEASFRIQELPGETEESLPRSQYLVQQQILRVLQRPRAPTEPTEEQS